MMTSLSLRKKAKVPSSFASEMSGRDYIAEREGIFDQFSAVSDSNKDLYYYAVYSSSDSEGNITAVDVQREKFGYEVTQAKVSGTENENETDGQEVPLHPKKRYGFRARRSRKHKDDDEFETSLVDSSGESGDEELKSPVSSDDETYDIEADNWTFVRGAKKKEGNRKKSESPKKSPLENSPKKPTPLRIRLKSAFSKKRDSKLQKLAENLRKAKIATKSKKAIALASQKSKKLPRKPDSQNSTKMSKSSPKKAQPSKVQHSDGSQTVKRLAAKSPNRIRCGYNSTAPKIQEIRPIRRRQLRQTPSRISQSGVSIYEETVSSSSDEDFDVEAPKTQGMRTRKISRIENESNLKEKTEKSATPGSTSSTTRKSTPLAPTSEKKQYDGSGGGGLAPSTGSLDSQTNKGDNYDDADATSSKTTRVSPRKVSKRVEAMTSQSSKATPSTASSVCTRAPPSDTTTTTTSTLNGNGLKLVIRRQSIDPPSHAVTSDMSPGPKTETKLREYSPGFLGARKKQILRTVQLKLLDVADKSTGKEGSETLVKKTDINGGQNENKLDVKGSENSEEKSELEKESEDKSMAPAAEAAADPEASPLSEPKDSPGSAGNKASPDEEAGKKKKAKKRRKKDRGRNGSTAGNEDAFDAQHTAMRLAMELPGHNWLVKNLIKEKKLKAEDDKPLNNLPDGEEGNAQSDGNTTVTKEQQLHVSLQQSTTEGLESHHASRQTDESTAARGEETQTTEGRKHPNAVKGSFMVGIVKPFQHLKMSPSKSMEVTEMSPPMLCIADEDEENETHGNENGHDTKAPTSENGNTNAPSKLQTLKEITGKDACSTKISSASCVLKAVITSTEDLIEASKRHMPGSVHTSITVNTAEISQCSAERDFTPSDFNPKVKLSPPTESEQGKVTESNETSEAKGQPKGNENASSANQNGHTGTSEIEPEIKISNCFSLALDLTKKVGKVSETKSPDSDQPLDLTLGPKTGQASPKVLDLSVKKSLPDPVPEKATPATPKPATVPQDKPFVSSDKAETASTSSPPPVANPPSVVQSELKATDANNNVIVIDDDPSDGSNKSVQTPVPAPSTPKTTASTTVLKTPPPKASPSAQGGSSANQLPQMKRAASCDSTPFQNLYTVGPAKRPRLSLDGFNPPRLSETQKPLAQPLRGYPQQPLVTRSNTIGPPVNVTNQKLQTLADSNRRLSDLLMISKTTAASIPNTGTLPIPTPLHIRPSSYPTMPIRKPPPSNPILPRPANGSSYIPTPRMSHTDFNNNGIMTASGRPNLGEIKMAPMKPGRHRSLDSSSHNTAQMVAQAYQSNVQQLEPYIKEQQRVVDQKIQELEAIKRQLASASASVKGKTPPPPYPQVAQPIGKIFTPSMQQRTVPSSLPHQRISPPRQYQGLPIPRPTTIRHSLPHHPSNVNINNSIALPQGQVVQSQYTRPPVPSASGGCPPVAVSHPSLPQPRIPGPASWRVLPPRVPDRGIDPSNISFQRSISNGGQIPAINASKISTNQTGPFSRPVTAPSQLVTNQIPPVSYLPAPKQSDLTRPQIPIPRMLPMTTAPVYRNGGLTINDTFKTRLNEPIVIEDDIIRSGVAQDSRKRPGQAQLVPESLKVRRAHSYHPPLSKNRAEQAQILQATNNQWSGRPVSGTYQGGQIPPPSEGPGEHCVKCRRKAYFLCSGCRKIWYCSKDCQVKDWSSHSAKCSG